MPRFNRVGLHLVTTMRKNVTFPGSTTSAARSRNVSTLSTADGRVLHVVAGVPAATHDLTVAQDNVDAFRVLLGENNAVLADVQVTKAYNMSFKRFCRTRIAAARHLLTRQQRTHNRHLARHRVVCVRTFTGV